MKSLKIEKKNAPEIEAALRKVNGKATNHVYTAFSELAEIADLAESVVLGIVKLKKLMPGARLVVRSGDELPKAYDYLRKVTRCTLVRKTAGWYLETVEADSASRYAAKPTILLTADQESAALSLFRAQYRLLQVPRECNALK